MENEKEVRKNKKGKAKKEERPGDQLSDQGDRHAFAFGFWHFKAYVLPKLIAQMSSFE